MPAAEAGNGDCDGCTKDTIFNSYAGPWCYCIDSKKPHYCTAPDDIPEQVWDFIRSLGPTCVCRRT